MYDYDNKCLVGCFQLPNGQKRTSSVGSTAFQIETEENAL